MEYNIKTLSFLTASFKDIMKNIGENEKGLSFYRRQVKGLVSIGQLNPADADFIERMLDIRNRKIVNFKDVNSNVTEFTVGMNEVADLSDLKAISKIVDSMVSTGVISERTSNFIKEIYNIKNDKTVSKKYTFGTFEDENEVEVKREEVDLSSFKDFSDPCGHGGFSFRTC